MPHAVDHRARKREIILKSIPIFAHVGYRDLTFQMISDRAGVARTVLYRYFHNKRQIFDAAIMEITSKVAAKNTEIMMSGAPCAERLRKLCNVVAASIFDNREFLISIIDFIMSMNRSGKDMSRRIPQFTIGLKRIIHSLLVEGVHRGEFRADINPERMTDGFYAIFESIVLRITVSNDAVFADFLELLDLMVKGVVK